MRIIAIGIGGAGCRIVDKLYFADRKSKNGKNPCVEAIAVDVDQKTIKDLRFLPEQNRLFFASLDPTLAESDIRLLDMTEISARIQTHIQGETDAVLICAGLGGSLAKAVPTLIETLRKTLVEPVFGLIVLPSGADGEKRIAEAAEDIDRIQPHLDGTILFDNETWYRKVTAKIGQISEKKNILPVFGSKKKTPEQEEMEIYDLMNEAMVRRVSLILRAGEVAAAGGRSNAEVVLDSGEILNTMLCDGYITIGYSLEHISKNPLNHILKKGAGADLFSDEQTAKASRIVELAKEAIYHEISTPCDMTSAQKALVLIAGPSRELSMKGFMTVRKWIDRSIEGIEVRSGDYPVENSSIVALIIMLAGVRNIPRLNELKEIRRQYLEGFSRRAARQQGIPAGESRSSREPSAKDRMIAVPPKMGAASGTKKTAKHPQADALPGREPDAPDGWDGAEGPADSTYQPKRDEARVAEEPEPDFWEQDDEAPVLPGSSRATGQTEVAPEEVPKTFPVHDRVPEGGTVASKEQEQVVPERAETVSAEPAASGTGNRADTDTDHSREDRNTESLGGLIAEQEPGTTQDSVSGPPEPETEGRTAPSRHRLIRVSEPMESTSGKKGKSAAPVPPETPLPPSPRRVLPHSSISSRDALIRRPSLPGTGSGGTSLSRSPSTGTAAPGRSGPGPEKESQVRPEAASPATRTGSPGGTGRNAFITPAAKENSSRSSQIQPQAKRFREPGVRIDPKPSMAVPDTGKESSQDVTPRTDDPGSPAKKKPGRQDPGSR